MVKSFDLLAESVDIPVGAFGGVLDDSQPLASHVLLSKGEGGEDGMLEARELMQMELASSSSATAGE